MPVLNRQHEPQVDPQAPSTAPSETANGRPLRAEQRLRAIVETAPVGLVAVAETNRILAGNSAAMRLMGRQRLTDDVLKVPFDEYMAPESRDAWREYRERALQGTSERVAISIALPDGVEQRTMVQAAELPQKAGDPRVLLCALWTADEPDPALDDAVAERDRLSARCDELLSDLENLTQQASGAQQVKDDHARLREEHEAETSRLQQLVESLQGELDAARAETELAKAQVVDLAAGQGAAGDDRRALERLRVECDRLSDERQTLIGVVESLRNELKGSREALGKSEERLDEQARTLEERRREHETATSERGDLARKNHELADAIRSLETELAGARTSREESEEFARQLQARFDADGATAQEALAAVRRELDERRQELEERVRERETAVQERAELARRNDALTESVGSLQAELAAARKSQTESEETTRQLQARIDADSAAAQQALAAVRRDLDEERAEVEELKRERDELVDERDRMSADFYALNNDLAEVRRTEAEAQAALAEQQEALRILRAQQEDLEQKRDALLEIARVISKAGVDSSQDVIVEPAASTPADDDPWRF